MKYSLTSSINKITRIVWCTSSCVGYMKNSLQTLFCAKQENINQCDVNRFVEAVWRKRHIFSLGWELTPRSREKEVDSFGNSYWYTVWVVRDSEGYESVHKGLTGEDTLMFFKEIFLVDNADSALDEKSYRLLNLMQPYPDFIPNGIGV